MWFAVRRWLFLRFDRGLRTRRVQGNGPLAQRVEHAQLLRERPRAQSALAFPNSLEIARKFRPRPSPHRVQGELHARVPCIT